MTLAQDSNANSASQVKDYTPIIVAVISAAATLAATLITVFAPEIFFAIKKRPSKSLKGMWNCKWSVIEPRDYEVKEITDTVEALKITGTLVKAQGVNPGFGKYQMEGRDSARALTLFYYGFGVKDNLVGVVILRKDVLTNKMSGYWWQYGKNEAILGGDTLWEKAL